MSIQKSTLTKTVHGGFMPWTYNALEKAGVKPADMPKLHDESDSIDTEAIAVSKPDLILGMQSGMTREQYETLSKIAPTVAYQKTAWGDPWRDMSFNGCWNTDNEQAVAHALSVTNLTELTDRPIEALSGGQRQRAWIALALAQETDILLLDEPITYLDIAYQIEVLDLLSRLNSSEGVTIVMVLHDLNLAARYADWILAMKDGRKMALGTPEEVITPSLLSEVFGLDTSVSIDPTTQLPMMMPGGSHCLATQRGPKLTAAAAELNNAQ